MRRLVCFTMLCLCLAGALAPLQAADTEFVKSASADLDGDGKKEAVSLTDIKDNGGFVLHVGSVKIAGQMQEAAIAPDGFQIVNIDGADKYHEVAVHTVGDSDFTEYRFYWYDGKALHAMGYITGGIDMPGNGSIYVGNWMGFWSKTVKYSLDKKTHLLKFVPQEFYYISVDNKPVIGTVLHSIPIYETRAAKAVVANLRVGSKVLFVLADGSDGEGAWYLVKSESGLLGWIRFKSINENFDGLMWAG